MCRASPNGQHFNDVSVGGPAVFLLRALPLSPMLFWELLASANGGVPIGQPLEHA